MQPEWVEDDVWPGRLLDWSDRSTWRAPLSAWLAPMLDARARQRLTRPPRRRLLLDDPGWTDRVARAARLETETLVEWLADDLMAAVLRTHHACRVPDAGVFTREGLRLNDPDVLAAEATRIVEEEEDLAWLRPSIGARIAGFEDRGRDAGRLYLAVDARGFETDSGHYLLYGSEWIQILLGWGAHEALRRRGVPTVVGIDLPIGSMHSDTRGALAGALLREWARCEAGGGGAVPELDLSVCRRRPVPAAWVNGHRHPARIRDPFHRVVRSCPTSCPACERDRAGTAPSSRGEAVSAPDRPSRS